MSSENAPDPPPSLPRYIADGLPKQDTGTLRDARSYIEALLEAREPTITEDELPDAADVVNSEAESGGTIVTERVKCGSDCTCNDGNGHGPYRYRYYRDRGTLKSEYLGKA